MPNLSSLVASVKRSSLGQTPLCRIYAYSLQRPFLDGGHGVPHDWRRLSTPMNDF
jgi:hypothetical protein